MIDLLNLLGGGVGVALLLLVGIYQFPNSPVRRAVDRWIDSRVDHRFKKDLEHYRHQLALDADRIRIEHQRLLHNASVVIERKHEVYRELFRLMHVATGGVTHLFGYREEPSFTDHSREDITSVLSHLPIPEGVRQPILSKWDEDRIEAIEDLYRVRRRVEIAEAERGLAEAWNYFLTNSLYLPETVSQKVSEVFVPLRAILGVAKFEHRQDVTGLRQRASDCLEDLKHMLRIELRVAPEVSDASLISSNGAGLHGSDRLETRG